MHISSSLSPIYQDNLVVTTTSATLEANVPANSGEETMTQTAIPIYLSAGVKAHIARYADEASVMNLRLVNKECRQAGTEAVKKIVVRNQKDLAQALRIFAPGKIDDLTLASDAFDDRDLQNLPLTLRRLNLSACSGLTAAGLAHLKGIPLQRLNLSECVHITDDALAHLRGMPLQYLDLVCCEHITDAGIAHLEGMPLVHLNLSYCNRITDTGLAYLHRMPLQNLNLKGLDQLTDAGLAYLQKIPLRQLNFSFCDKITNAGLAYLQKMSLEKLTASCCAKTTNIGLVKLTAPTTRN